MILTTQLLSVGIMLHIAVHIAANGYSYVLDNSLPALGLKISKNTLLVLNTMTATSAILCLVEPGCSIFKTVLFILLSLLCLSHPWRLSNHLVLAWFMLFGVVALPKNSHEPFIQTLVISTYFFASLHKMNQGYLSTNRSLGVFLSSSVFSRVLSPSRAHRLGVLLGRHCVVALELMVGLLLLRQETLPVGLFLGLALHLFFGVLCHVHFSTIMLAGLICFTPTQAALQELFVDSLIPSALFCFLANILGVSKPYGKSLFLGRVLYLFFGVVCGVFVAAIMPCQTASTTGWTIVPMESMPIGFYILVVLYWLNALSPYIGIKTEFSLAMFSNLRPDVDDHLFLTVRSRVEHIRILKLPAADVSLLPANCKRFWQLLSKHEELIYSRYFLNAAFRELLRAGVIFEGATIEYEDTSTRSIRSIQITSGSNVFPSVFPGVLRPPYLSANTKIPPFS